MSLLETFVRRPVLAIALNLILLIMGIVAFNQLELRLKPKAEANGVYIHTGYPGANSLSVEQQVTKPIEDALAGLDGILSLNSSSENNKSNVYVKFKSDANSAELLGQVRDRVLSISEWLPKTVSRPSIEEQSENDLTILYLKFEDTEKSLPELSDYIKRNVEDRLRLVEGVAALSAYGNQLYRVSIHPDPARLVEYGVTLQEVIHALKQEKKFASGGEIERITSKASVVLTGLIEKPSDFENIVVRHDQQGRVTIGNIGSVSLSHTSTFLKMRINGRYVVGLSVTAKPKANPLTVVKNVQAFMSDLQRSLPPSLKASISFDATQAFMSSLSDMRHTLWESIVLVGVIVTLSLASFRAAVLPMLTIPLCLMGTFAIMLALGFSLNPVTLLALVLAVGLVVDDAIVVVENIYKHLEEGVTAQVASIRSLKEIGFAVIVMTVTLAAVYLPLIFQTDASAVIFKEFAWTLAGSVLISGVVALTLTPTLCARFLKKPAHSSLWERVGAQYRQSLTWAFQYPRAMFVLLGILAFAAIVGFQQLPSETIPAEDEGYLSGWINADNGVSEPVRESWLNQVEAILKKVPEQERIMTGIYQDKWMWWNIILKPTDQRKRTSFEIAKGLQTQFKQVVGPLVQVEAKENLGGSEPLKVIIQSAGDPGPLLTAIRSIIQETGSLPQFSSIQCPETAEKPRLKVWIDKRLAFELGISTEAIEETLYTFLSGKKVTEFHFDGQDYDVEVRAHKQFRDEVDHLNLYFVKGSEGQWVPLGSLVQLKEVLEPDEIKHFDRIRGVELMVSLNPKVGVDEALSILEPILKKYMPEGARYQFGGKAAQYESSRHSLVLTFVLALIFIYLVLAALFESFIHPLTVLLTVPLSIAGAVWTIHGMGGSNNVYMIIGLVTLIGLISKHGILIVDFSNQLQEKGLSPKEAVFRAAHSRLRPVLMTTFAMVFGAIPLVLSQGTGAVSKAHIGWVVIAGMLVGTLFSLFVIPVVYETIARHLKKPLKTQDI